MASLRKRDACWLPSLATRHSLLALSQLSEKPDQREKEKKEEREKAKRKSNSKKSESSSFKKTNDLNEPNLLNFVPDLNPNLERATDGGGHHVSPRALGPPPV